VKKRMAGGPILGFIYGIILLIIGGLGIYSLDYLNNTYTAYLLVILGIIGIICGIYFSMKTKK
jgi:hypothetical protein